MTDNGPHVLIDLYELPHLFGFWISEPEEKEWWTAETGEPWQPRCWMFLGDHHIIEIKVRPDEDDPGETITSARAYVYEVDGPDLVIQRLDLADDNKLERSETIEVPWAITDDGRINITMGDIIWRGVPASREELIAAGFHPDMIDEWLTVSRDAGYEVIEKFDLETARKLIAEARAREDAEN